MVFGLGLTLANPTDQALKRIRKWRQNGENCTSNSQQVKETYVALRNSLPCWYVALLGKADDCPFGERRRRNLIIGILVLGLAPFLVVNEIATGSPTV